MHFGREMSLQLEALESDDMEVCGQENLPRVKPEIPFLLVQHITTHTERGLSRQQRALNHFMTGTLR